MAQSLAKVYIHVVFSTKNREPVLAQEWREDLFKILAATANQMGCRMTIAGGHIDHVHILFELNRTITLAEIVGRIKSNSSAWANQTRSFGPNFHWQNGYGAFSVSQSQLDAVKNYIENQEEHHKKISFQDELRNWLKKYQIEWDERYIWD